MRFPVSGVETPIWLPPLVACAISFFTSMCGISGAFLILPFQLSILHFTSPAVSATNLVFNIIAIPSGVGRYLREGRMVWPLTWIVVAGTLPGVIVGGFVRLIYLPDAGAFKVFVACVLFYVGVRMLLTFRRDPTRTDSSKPLSGLHENAAAADWKIHAIGSKLQWLVFEFQGKAYRPSGWGIFSLSLAVGVVGGIYGIGGGAIIAPFLVAIFGLPIHAVAGATLMGTFVTSAAGVVFYQGIAPYYGRPGMGVSPDWLLGTLFGLGGLVGMDLGARTQRFIPARWLKLFLVSLLLFVAIKYLSEAV